MLASKQSQNLETFSTSLETAKEATSATMNESRAGGSQDGIEAKRIRIIREIPRLLSINFKGAKGLYPSLDVALESNQVPIIYCQEYNIDFFGIQKLHPFDVTKWGRVVKILTRNNVLKEFQIVKPNRISAEELKGIHSFEYLDSLNSSRTVARISEMSILQLIPNYWIQKKLLKPLQYHVGGSALGVRLALEKGWAVNLGGGFHHCSFNRGGGFCMYADITLCVRVATKLLSRSHRIMIVDLDAHQGNGYARDLKRDRNVFILDAYNPEIYPQDAHAASAVRCPVLIHSFTQDQEYLDRISLQFRLALEEFAPHFLIYNAGTDCLAGDKLGHLSISPDGVVKRDELIFQECKTRSIPILMLTSGGYLTENAEVIARSLTNLIQSEIISL